jgi:hypothetical protein
MNHKRITMMSIVLATLMLVSLFAVVSSTASVSGKASGTTAALATKPVGVISYGPYGPGVSNMWKNSENDVFAVDTSGALWYRSIYSDGTWNPLGGVCTASPAAISWDAKDRMDVVVRGSDNALWHIYSNDGGTTWSNWESLGGQLASGTGPAVSSWSAGRLDVFVQGTDGALWHKWWNGATWSGWESLGGQLTSSPAATSTGNGLIDVFARGTDGACWYKVWSGTAWSSWKSLGGQLASGTGPGVGQNLAVFVQGTDNQLWHYFGEGGWGWSSWVLSGALPEALSTSSPASTVVVTMDHTMVCVSGTSGNVWWSADSLNNWSYWYSVGTPP